MKSEDSYEDISEYPAVIFQDDNQQTTPFRAEDVTDEDVKAAMLGLLTLQELTNTSEGCPGEDEAPCGDHCTCLLNDLIAATIVLLSNGPDKEGAALFIHDYFDTATGNPRTYH